jgi:hypothetical protein
MTREILTGLAMNKSIFINCSNVQERNNALEILKSIGVTLNISGEGYLSGSYDGEKWLYPVVVKGKESCYQDIHAAIAAAEYNVYYQDIEHLFPSLSQRTDEEFAADFSAMMAL